MALKAQSRKAFKNSKLP